MRRVEIGGFAVALVAQFWFGIWVALYVDIPKRHPGANSPEYFAGIAQGVVWAILHGPSVWLVLHASLGLVLALGAVGLVARAIVDRSRGQVIALTVGALGVLAAGFNGGSFLDYRQDLSSMLMATGLAVALIAYLIAMALPSASSSTEERPTP